MRENVLPSGLGLEVLIRGQSMKTTTHWLVVTQRIQKPNKKWRRIILSLTLFLGDGL